MYQNVNSSYSQILVLMFQRSGLPRFHRLSNIGLGLTRQILSPKIDPYHLEVLIGLQRHVLSHLTGSSGITGSSALAQASRVFFIQLLNRGPGLDLASQRSNTGLKKAISIVQRLGNKSQKQAVNQGEMKAKVEKKFLQKQKNLVTDQIQEMTAERLKVSNLKS